MALPLSGDRKPFPVLESTANEVNPQLSPDDRWLAYGSDESGRPEIYVQHFPPSGGKWQISANGGSRPRWRQDGNEIFYMSRDFKIMAVDIETVANNFVSGTPHALFDAHPNNRGEFAVTANGQKFLIGAVPGASDASAAPVPLTIVLNWVEGLKRRVGVH